MIRYGLGDEAHCVARVKYIFSSPPPEGCNWNSPTDLHNRQNNRELYRAFHNVLRDYKNLL
jgi:hypothetical protein